VHFSREAIGITNSTVAVKDVFGNIIVANYVRVIG